MNKIILLVWIFGCAEPCPIVEYSQHDTLGDCRKAAELWAAANDNNRWACVNEATWLDIKGAE